MNINIFFIFLFLVLMSIFLFFKPMHMQNSIHTEVPNSEIYSFSIYKLDTKGLNTIFKGSKALVYEDRYEVSNVDYKDSSKKNISNIKANTGVYKDNIIYLKGDVVYTRDDGLIFKSQSFQYNEKTEIAKTNDKYIMYSNKNKVTGKSLKINNKLNKIYSKNITAKYQIREK